jgi:HEAT repeat protein
LDLPLDVAEDGYYELLAQIAHAPNYGLYVALLDGQPVFDQSQLEHEPGADNSSANQMPLYNLETYVATDHLLGWHQLKRGRHTVSFICTGKQSQSTGFNLGIDTLILAKVASPLTMGGTRASELRAIGTLAERTPAQVDTLVSGLGDSDADIREASAWAITQMGDGAKGFVPNLKSSLSDSDPVVRGLAAVALRNVKMAAVPALDTLIGKLKDSDVNVRMMSADAISQFGKKALPALSALIQACAAEGEHVHVLRNLASALGAIGPDAASALPVLRKLQLLPRVRWSAEAAIRDITREP